MKITREDMAQLGIALFDTVVVTACFFSFLFICVAFIRIALWVTE